MLDLDHNTVPGRYLSVPGKRPLLPWLRFLHLRSYGRTHLAVAWRLAGQPTAQRQSAASGLPATEPVSATPRETPDKPCARR